MTSCRVKHVNPSDWVIKTLLEQYGRYSGYDHLKGLVFSFALNFAEMSNFANVKGVCCLFQAVGPSTAKARSREVAYGCNVLILCSAK